MSVCPTCGQPIRLTSPDRVLALLADTRNGRARDLYKGNDGSWYITYGGGPVDPVIVHQLVESGKIVRTYDNCEDSFTIGKTMDTGATLEARKRRELKTGEVIYTDGSKGP